MKSKRAAPSELETFSEFSAARKRTAIFENGIDPSTYETCDD